MAFFQVVQFIVEHFPNFRWLYGIHNQQDAVPQKRIFQPIGFFFE